MSSTFVAQDTEKNLQKNITAIIIQRLQLGENKTLQNANSTIYVTQNQKQP